MAPGKKWQSCTCKEHLGFFFAVICMCREGLIRLVIMATMRLKHKCSAVVRGLISPLNGIMQLG